MSEVGKAIHELSTFIKIDRQTLFQDGSIQTNGKVSWLLVFSFWRKKAFCVTWNMPEKLKEFKNPPFIPFEERKHFVLRTPPSPFPQSRKDKNLMKGNNEPVSRCNWNGTMIISSGRNCKSPFDVACGNNCVVEGTPFKKSLSPRVWGQTTLLLNGKPHCGKQDLCPVKQSPLKQASLFLD